MAHQYVLADQMYASDFDVSSFISHQYIIAGMNPNSSVNYPDGDWGCTGGPGDKIPVLFKDRNGLTTSASRSKRAPVLEPEDAWR